MKEILKRGREDKNEQHKTKYSISNQKMDTKTFYTNLKKPNWAPPSWLFGPVWSVLYVIIAVSFGTVFFKAFSGQISWKIALPFVFNLIFNLAFTPLQFGLRNTILAAVDILLVLTTLVWSLVAIFPYMHWVAFANTPYFLWVLFAAALQMSITFLNFKNKI